MIAYLTSRQVGKFSVRGAGYGGACAAREYVAILWRICSDGGAGTKYIFCCYGVVDTECALCFLRAWEDGGNGMEYIVLLILCTSFWRRRQAFIGVLCYLSCVQASGGGGRLLEEFCFTHRV